MPKILKQLSWKERKLPLTLTEAIDTAQLLRKLPLKKHLTQLDLEIINANS